MAKEIKDYLHLYLGCGIEFPTISVKPTIRTLTSDLIHFALERGAKPILRPLSDMTEEEAQLFDCIYPLPMNYKFPNAKWTFEEVRLLLSKHFDLFGLIEAGLAIDKTKHTA